MEPYIVDFLINLLKKDKAVIEGIKTKEDFDKLITEYYDSLKDLKTFSPAEYDKLIANTKTEALNELTDEAKIPKNIYDKIRANSLEVKEKTIAKKYDISDWKGIDDLIEKISAKTSGESEKDKEIQRLKDLNRADEEKHNKELADAKNETENFISSDYLDREVKNIPVDAVDEAQTIEAQNSIKAIFLNKGNKLSRKDNKMVVLDKDGKVITDRLGDPLPVSDVLRDSVPSFIKLKSLEGGRGDDSTKNQGDGIVRTTEDYYALRDKKGIKANSYEDAQLLAEVQAKNPTFQLA